MHSLATWHIVLLAFCVVLCTCVIFPSKHTMNVTISKTWNNKPIPKSEQIHIKLQYKHNKNLRIDVLAPFYDDPKLPDMTKNPGTMEKLFDYEVVEVFLLGENEHYLEIELGPRGQYLVLELKGYRNVTRYPIDLAHYQTKIEDNHWSATAEVPHNLIPAKTNRFNAYAIHKSDEKRQYLALFPAPSDSKNYTQPDFHRLELFGKISIFNKH